MNRARLPLAIALAAALVNPGWPQPPQKPADSAPTAHELATITARGTMLAAYDQAVRYATGAVMLSQPSQGKIERYIARVSVTGWTVDFGRLNADGTKFLTAYEAVQSDAPTHFAVGQFDPERQDTGFNLTAARAIDLALRDFGRFSQPYKAAVLPSAPAGVLVYLYPAQSKDGVYLYGGDVRYLVSPDGTKILDKHPMHNGILESTPAQIPAGATPAPGTHTHTLTTLPEDTDVFLVLSRDLRVPEYINAGSHTYKIETDGTITTDPPGIPLPLH